LNARTEFAAAERTDDVGKIKQILTPHALLSHMKIIVLNECYLK